MAGYTICTDMGLVAELTSLKETELSRLGSSKSLYAATSGELAPQTVLEAAATAEFAAAETFSAWEVSESNPTAAELFRRVAEDERHHFESISGELETVEPTEVPAIQTYLRSCDTTIERVGGLLGRILVADRSKDQLIGYFVGQASPQLADQMRSLKTDLPNQQEQTLDVIATLGADNEEAILDAACQAIDIAYEEYTTQLETLGVNPKPVC